MKFNLDETFETEDGTKIVTESKVYISDVLKMLQQLKVAIPAQVAHLANEPTPVTLGSIIHEAVTTITLTEKGKNMSGEEKYMLYKIAKKLGEGEVVLEAKEVAKIKDAIGNVYNNVTLLGKAWELLEHPITEEKAEKK